MALVFLSCGQREGEKEYAKQIEEMIKSEFRMDCYNADSIQGFDDVMSIVDQLSKADYYLFIDFKRDCNPEISVFSHQEFALARAWGLTEMLAFKEEGLQRHGMLSYLLVHPADFARERLVETVRKGIEDKGWNNDYSRNLVVFADPEHFPKKPLIVFTDHTGSRLQKVWFLHVRNNRKDRAAFNTVAILRSVTNEETGEQSRPDSSYLKWAGQTLGYSQTIFPEDEAHFTAFAVGEAGIFLHSSADVQRMPIINTVGRYKLEYHIYSESFPYVRATVALNYTDSLGIQASVQPSSTSATLLK